MIVMVIAAHPDDEVLGAGGTIARHVASGDSVSVVIVAEGATSRGVRTEERNRDETAALRGASAAAARELGIHPPVHFGLPDNRLDELALLDIVQLLEREIDRVRPEVIYTHHHGDLNIDHRIVHGAVLTAARPVPGCPVRAVYCFETPSSTEWGQGMFRPQRFVDISAWLEAKRRALECYVAEMRAFPHARSIESVEALARVRGVTCGLPAAEAFEVAREICCDVRRDAK